MENKRILLLLLLLLIPGGTTNRYNENLKRPWYCRVPCWKQLHGEGKTTRKTFYLMYWTNRANRKRPFVISLYILSVCVCGGGGHVTVSLLLKTFMA